MKYLLVLFLAYFIDKEIKATVKYDYIEMKVQTSSKVNTQLNIQCQQSVKIKLGENRIHYINVRKSVEVFY